MLSKEEKERYARQLILEEVGEEGQEKLKEARVLMVGAGGLGSPCTFYLAAVGVGTIGIVDSDVVELSNLQRQILHQTESLGELKVDSAEKTLQALNPELTIEKHKIRLDQNNAREIVSRYDVIINGVDNFPTRYLLNDACYMEKKPLVEGGVLRFDGLLMTILPDEGPCYRCIFPEIPAEGSVPSTSEAGLLGTIPGICGTIQATEAVKVILKIGETFTGRVLAFHALKGHFDVMEWPQEKSCPLCGENPTIQVPGEKGS